MLVRVIERPQLAGALLLMGLSGPQVAEGQARWRDLVVTLGGSFEGYTGNFSAVALAVVDSTDHATAAVGEVGVRGALALYEVVLQNGH